MYVSDDTPVSVCSDGRPEVTPPPGAADRISPYSISSRHSWQLSISSLRMPTQPSQCSPSPERALPCSAMRDRERRPPCRALCSVASSALPVCSSISIKLLVYNSENKHCTHSHLLNNATRFTQLIPFLHFVIKNEKG